MPPAAFADCAAAEYLDERVVANLPAPLRDALRDVAARGAHAATLARLSVLSPAARALAAAALPAPARTVCIAKAAALRDVVAAARDADLLDQKCTQTVLLALCTDMPPPLRCPDDSAAGKAEVWRSFSADLLAEMVLPYSPRSRFSRIMWLVSSTLDSGAPRLHAA